MPCPAVPHHRAAARPPRRLPSPLLVFLAVCLACGGGGAEAPAERPAAGAGGGGGDRAVAVRAATPRAVTAPADDSAVATPTAGRPVVVFLGDSLTAGYGLGEAQAFPARLEALLAEQGMPFRAVNAGVSGDTSAGGLARLDWVLSSDPDVVVVELGPNDGLRGLDLSMTEDNLRRIVTRIRAAGARVLLVGMRIPPNYGPDYAGRFADLYPRLAKELDVPLVPFLLAGVGGVPELNQGDGIHPTAEGQRLVAANVEPYLEPLVAAAWRQRGGVPDAAP